MKDNERGDTPNTVPPVACPAMLASIEETEHFLLFVSTLRQEMFAATLDGYWYKWDVTRANEMLDARNAPIEVFRPGDWAICPEHVLERYPDLDIEYAVQLTDEDMTRPLLFVPLGGKHQLIDGWHRLYKAVTDGRDALSARVLTDAEVQAVLVK